MSEGSSCLRGDGKAFPKHRAGLAPGHRNCKDIVGKTGVGFRLFPLFFVGEFSGGFFCLVGVSLGCMCYYLSMYLICYLFGICVFTACSFYSSEVMTFYPIFSMNLLQWAEQPQLQLQLQLCFCHSYIFLEIGRYFSLRNVLDFVRYYCIILTLLLYNEC